ncbi:hypothetical protein DYB36_007920 [Aphanomyces astaci]|uniref:Phosphatidic acid phosphatase type 2/haloperoxidase domain-containing protein n=1 Tax=Aphanomyces astaci TaxID=112090 RepID=A0A397ASB7_APHAT|nr:hypothetical protein DYB36_007920 [Aphanomyces astaci]
MGAFGWASLPLLLALWVGVTRYQDKWHHTDDVLAGAVIGAGCAYAAHSCYFVLFQVDRKHADEDPISTDGYSTLPCLDDAVAV